MPNRYDVYVEENQERITHLKERIERFLARGVRLSSIPQIEEEIAKLERQIITYRGTSKLVQEMYGEWV